MDKIEWCIQTKNRLEFVEPNDNLCDAYFAKAENALKAKLALQGNSEWEISATYYTMYFGLYAILMKIGIKSEIHSCSLEFQKRFLTEYFTKKELTLIQKAFKARNDSQYYTDRNVSEETKKELMTEAPDFLIKCKSTINALNETEIESIRQKTW